MAGHNKRPRILYLVTEDWYFVSHRLGLARAVRDAGCEVIVVTRFGDHADAIRREGMQLISFLLPRSRLSLISELKSIVNLVRVYRQVRPDLVHHVALKPSLYGSLAVRFAPGTAVVNAMTGLGFVFTSGHWLGRLLEPLVRLGGRLVLSPPRSRFIIQNTDDLETLRQAGIVRGRDYTLIPGSGVDLTEYPPQPDPVGPPTVAMVSRLLWNKGVGTLVKAARLLKARDVPVRVLLVGMPDAGNPTSIPADRLCEWHDDGLVQWWGYRDDVAQVWRQTHVAVLPSYREGLPKSLLEAAASARPIVATDVPGCREIVHHGVNGLLVPMDDAPALADAIAALLKDAALRRRMGAASRALVENRFHQDLIVRATIEIYESLLGTELRLERPAPAPA